MKRTIGALVVVGTMLIGLVWVMRELNSTPHRSASGRNVQDNAPTAQARSHIHDASAPVAPNLPAQVAIPKPRMTWRRDAAERKAEFDEWARAHHLTEGQQEQVMIALSDAADNARIGQMSWTQELYDTHGAPIPENERHEGWKRSFTGEDALPDLLERIQEVAGPDAAADFNQRFWYQITAVLNYDLERAPDAG
jgi:hypothetical protein